MKPSLPILLSVNGGYVDAADETKAYLKAKK